jgi:peroxiredoxin
MRNRTAQSPFVAMFLACALTSLSPVADAIGVGAPDVGAKAPDFTVHDYVNGETIKLSAQRGKVAVVTFWATWCAPCRSELPNLEKLQEYLGRDKLTILAVNFRDDDAATIARLRQDAKEAGWKLHLALDPGERIARAYGISTIPRMYIIGKDGRISAVHAGFGDGSLEDMVTDLKTVLDAKPGEPAARPAATP